MSNGREPPHLGARSSWLVRVCGAQGVFYGLSGVWPLLSPQTFQAVTGFKADFWLAQTVGAILSLVGVVLILAARAKRITPEIVVLGAGLAGVLLVVDILCVRAPRTTRAYWLDAVAETALVAGWLIAVQQHRRKARG